MCNTITRQLKKIVCSACGIVNIIYLTTTISVIVLMQLFYVNYQLKSVVPIANNVKQELKVFISFRSLSPSTNPTPLPTTFRKFMSKIQRPVTKRPDMCQGCFAHNYTYILDNEDICSTGDGKQEVNILVLISTTHKNTESRKALRETWLSPSWKNTGDVRYAFLLGMAPDSATQVAIETESATYQDIIQEDFVDSYNNLTLKTMMAFKWASTKCKNAKYFMKTDDDMYVNLESLKNTLRKNSFVLQKSIGGFCNLSREPIRTNTSKWYAPFEMFPHKEYPPYCSGTGYVTSLDVVQKVYQVSKNIPFFYLEDVYVSLCMKKLGLNMTHLPGFHADQQKPGCVYKTNELVTSHRLTPKLLKEIWNKKCNDV
ncbi:beta-1,3-galactosyltransferase 1-like [Saccostrea echinata]|uniref:beta-1,3-galactosyltransferase 1-like n=1 Tax=Saccostrea echinata TaxID=191078 RepID=UPI002A8024F1|nr:beta-1,3-galactosyltransferase 1-like [Saccostrea echinata]